MSKTSELRRLRKYHELTHQDMADLIHVDLRTYINKEKGISQFKASEMWTISKRFNKSMDEIFLPENFTLHEVSCGKEGKQKEEKL